jgi:hypothetical protein
VCGGTVIARAMTAAEARAEVVQRLVAQLESMVERHRAADHDGRSLGDDAELITGEVARYLAGARAALSAVPHVR